MRAASSRGLNGRHVVVAADGEAHHAVGFFVASGEHQYRQVGMNPQPTADLEAIYARQTDVEDDQAYGMPTNLGQRLFAAAHPDDGVALVRKVVLNELSDAVLVLHKQDRGSHALSIHLPECRGCGIDVLASAPRSHRISTSRMGCRERDGRSWHGPLLIRLMPRSKPVDAAACDAMLGAARQDVAAMSSECKEGGSGAASPTAGQTAGRRSTLPE